MFRDQFPRIGCFLRNLVADCPCKLFRQMLRLRRKVSHQVRPAAVMDQGLTRLERNVAAFHCG